MIKTAVIYARYSSDNQTEQSIEGQLHVCEDYARANNILIVNTYIDRAMTGTNDHRPEFQRMIKDSSRKEWDYVLIYKLDRFSRNKYETAIHKKTLLDNGVKVLSATENIPDTPEGIILESLLEGMNQYYSAELSQKIKRGMRENRRKGFYQGGGLPYGYKVVDKKIYIDEERAEVVRYMFDQYSKGVYVSNIIKTLTEKGILYKGQPFPRNTVSRILSNEKYLGFYKKDNETVDNMYPQIISNEIFQKVRTILNQNKFGKRCIIADYLLRFKVKCGYCGRPMSSDTGTGRTGGVRRYYKCIGRKKEHNGCMNPAIRKETLEKIVIDTIIEKLGTPEVIQYAISTLMTIQQNQANNNSLLKILEKEKNDTDKALKNIMTAIENGIVISKTTNTRIQELEERQEKLEREILIEQNKCTVSFSEEMI